MVNTNTDLKEVKKNTMDNENRISLKALAFISSWNEYSNGSKISRIYHKIVNSSHPDYSGSNLMVNGELKDVAMWYGVSKKTGAKYLSLQIKEPYKKDDQPKNTSSEEKAEDLPF